MISYLFFISILTTFSNIISFSYLSNHFNENYLNPFKNNKNALTNQHCFSLRHLTISSLTCNDGTQQGDWSYYTMTYNSLTSDTATAAEIAATQVRLYLPAVGAITSNETGTAISSGDQFNLPFIMKYTQDGYGYYTSVKFNYVYGNISSPDCYIHYYICNQGCKQCNKTNWCEVCKDNYYFREDDSARCYYSSTGYYLDTNIFRKCYSLCYSCSSGGTSLYNNSKSCSTGYYKVTKETTYNCYKNCPGTKNGSSCTSVIYFEKLTDTVAVTNKTRSSILSGMDNYIFGFYEVSPKIEGSNFVVNTFWSNTTKDYSTSFSISECEKKLSTRYNLKAPFLFAKVESTSEPNDADYKVYASNGTALDINVCLLSISCSNYNFNGYYESSYFKLLISDQNLEQAVTSGTKIHFIIPSNFKGNLVVNSSSINVDQSLSYSQQNTFRYDIFSFEGQYTDTFEYFYSYGDYISDTCTITYIICAEHCYSCTSSNWCTQCFENTTYYLEDKRDKCYYPLEHYFIYQNVQLELCSDICKNCVDVSEVKHHKCTECYEDHYPIQRDNTYNCYFNCPGPVINDQCDSIVYFKDGKDDYIYTDSNFSEITKNIDDYILGFKEVNYTIKGDTFTVDIFFTNTTAEHNVFFHLSECEDKLQSTYGLPPPFLFAIVETNSTDPDYHGYLLNGTSIDISICKIVDIPLPDTLTPEMKALIQKMALLGVDLFNPDDPFFNDICFPYAAENGTDVTLKDRRSYMFMNVSICEDGCKYKGYNTTTEKVKCDCNVSSVDETNYNDEKFFQQALDTTNILIAKCYKIVFDINNYIDNYGFWFAFSAFVLCFNMMIYYGCYYYKVFIKKIMPQLASSPTVRIIEKFQQFSISEESTASSKNVIKVTNSKFQPTSVEDDELDKLPYTAAQRKDKRSCAQMFYFIFISKLELLNIVVYPGPFDVIYISLSVYIFSIGLDFTMNALLFTDDVISQKFHNGSVKTTTTIFLSILSNILSYCLSYYIVKYSTFSFVFEEVKLQIKDEKQFMMMQYKLYKIIRNRLIIFFTLELILLLGCIYYVIIFCTIYHQSQVNWLIDCLSSFGISILSSFAMSLLVSLLRYIGLRLNSDRIYNIAKYLNE